MLFATAEQIKAKGVELAAEPRREAWGTMGIFKDPDGNQFVFSEPMRAGRRAAWKALRRSAKDSRKRGRFALRVA